MQAGGTGDGGNPVDLDGDEAIEPEELAFAHEDERLPWLEADEDSEEGTVDTTRVIAFVLVALLVLAAVIGGLWWAFRDRTDGTLVADGSTIAAPAEPYKEKPADPGGAEAVGTGDASFAVAEGESVEGKVAVPEAPRPSIDRNQQGTGQAGGTGEATSAATAGVGVQVGAYSSRDRAESGWSTLAARYPALDGVSHRIVQATVDGSPIYRLQAVASDIKTAQALCSALRQQGGDCQVKD